MPDKESDPIAQEPAQSQFQLRKIYTKDISFESPNAPGIFSKAVNPSININLSTSSLGLGDDEYEVTLAITLAATHQEDTIFLVEMEQSGIFLIEQVPDDRLAKILAIRCPEILFPYARQVISDMVMSGGYPPLLLAPVNFAALYQEQHGHSRERAETAH